MRKRGLLGWMLCAAVLALQGCLAEPGEMCTIKERWHSHTDYAVIADSFSWRQVYIDTAIQRHHWDTSRIYYDTIQERRDDFEQKSRDSLLYTQGYQVRITIYHGLRTDYAQCSGPYYSYGSFAWDYLPDNNLYSHEGTLKFTIDYQTNGAPEPKLNYSYYDDISAMEGTLPMTATATRVPKTDPYFDSLYTQTYFSKNASTRDSFPLYNWSWEYTLRGEGVYLHGRAYRFMTHRTFQSCPESASNDERVEGLFKVEAVSCGNYGAPRPPDSSRIQSSQ